ncbi:MAG: terpene cyclase/mutase family protein [Verrucomicrobia bacterium]|nr:terpene cyclase/mutase family protein [Verrucomicrobiota bacterium]MCH8513722.1 terpene cyclase/mutase family protein [Kiritimatiellia bacterium]
MSKNPIDPVLDLHDHEISKQSAKSKRNATLVSVAVHVVLVLLATLIVAMTIPEKEDVAFESPPPPRPRLEPRKLEMQVRVNQLTRRSARPQVQPRMMVDAPSDLALPEVKQNPDVIKNQIVRNFNTMGMTGVGQGLGGGYGTGMGGGTGGMGLPASMADRCSATNRSARMRATGGRASSERAVTNALAWLQTQQNPDGSWGQQHKPAMTGLAVLAYLGHCETPDSPMYGETVKRGLDFLAEVACSSGNNGLPAGTSGHARSYSHGIVTYALGEAYIMTGMPEYRDPFRCGVEVIIRAQQNDGGWVYAMNGGNEGGDTSVSGWQVQAMKSAYLAGLDDIEGLDAALDKSMDFMKLVHQNDGGFAYRPGRNSHTDSLTGIGVFTLAMWKEGNSPEARAGVNYIMNRVGDERRRGDARRLSYDSMHTYGMYYDVQAMFAVGGREWRRFNDYFQSSLVEAQNADGSWPPNGGNLARGGDDGPDGQIYRTALHTLMLEVYYRYLPVTDM